MKFRHYKRLISHILILWLMVIPLLTLIPATPIQAAATGNSIEDKPFPAEKINNSQAEAADSTSLGWTLFKVVISLLVIILLAYLIIRVFGKQVNRRFRGRWLQVLDELIIGPNRGVVLCEIGGRILALGVTDHSINVLFEVNDEHLIKEMLAEGANEHDEWSQLSAMKGLIDRVKRRRTDRFGVSLDQWMEQSPDNIKERGHRQ